MPGSILFAQDSPSAIRSHQCFSTLSSPLSENESLPGRVWPDEVNIHKPVAAVRSVNTSQHFQYFLLLLLFLTSPVLHFLSTRYLPRQSSGASTSSTSDLILVQYLSPKVVRFYSALLTPDVCINANASCGHRISHQGTAPIPIATVGYCLPVWQVYTPYANITYMPELFLHLCGCLATYMCMVGSHY